MRKIFFIFIFLSLTSIVLGQITGEVITGEATSSNFGLSLTVGGFPILIIHSPENETYLRNNISLNFTSLDYSNMWYRVNSGANNSITGPIFLNLSDGSYILDFYSNNSVGVRHRSVSFTVNSSYFIILSTEYSGVLRGNSTNFSQILTRSKLEDFPSLVLENSAFGKISFSENINLTNDLQNDDFILDLDSYTQISSNNIYIDSVNLPNLNKSATLKLYNLTFSSPRILKDGTPCSSPECTLINYDSGNLTFAVSSFSNYSADETPASSSSSSSSGGGGGSSQRLLPIENPIRVSPESLSLKIKKGEEIKKELVISSLLNAPTSVKVSNNLNGIVTIEKPSFVLLGQENQSIVLTIDSNNLSKDLTIGKVLVESDYNNFSKEIPISITFQDDQEYLSINIALKDRPIFSEENISPTLLINNSGLGGKIPVNLSYQIINLEGEILYEESESILLENSVKLEKNFKIPGNLPPGSYVLYVQGTYSGKSFSSTKWFNIIKKESFINRLLGEGYVNAIYFLSGIVGLSIIIWAMRKIRRVKKYS